MSKETEKMIDTFMSDLMQDMGENRDGEYMLMDVGGQKEEKPGKKRETVRNGGAKEAGSRRKAATEQDGSHITKVEDLSSRERSLHLDLYLPSSIVRQLRLVSFSKNCSVSKLAASIMSEGLKAEYESVPDNIRKVYDDYAKVRFK